MAGSHAAKPAGETVTWAVIPPSWRLRVHFFPLPALETSYSTHLPVPYLTISAMFSTSFSVLVTSLRLRKPSTVFASESQGCTSASFFRVGARGGDGNRLARRLKRLCACATGQST